MKEKKKAHTKTAPEFAVKNLYLSLDARNSNGRSGRVDSVLEKQEKLIGCCFVELLFHGGQIASRFCFIAKGLSMYYVSIILDFF